MTSQLLIEMPAEGAARLLTLSLLEELSQYAAGTASDPRLTIRHAAAYRAGVRRLRSCIVLYADALDDGVTRKARRRLGSLSNAAERFHRADVQFSWCSARVSTPVHAAGVGVPGDGARAAVWLCDRIERRRERAVRALHRAQSDGRPLRRIAKRLGVYTTAVRLDAIQTSHSFARMTSDQLIANADALGTALRTARGAGSHAELRRALRSAERLTYLLEPIRAYADTDEPSARVIELRTVLDRLDGAAIVGRAIVRGGRRVAALHAQEVLRTAIWPAGELPAIAETGNGRAPVTQADLQRGLLVLAEELRDEAAREYETLSRVWEESVGQEFLERVAAIAGELRA